MPGIIVLLLACIDGTAVINDVDDFRDDGQEPCIFFACRPACSNIPAHLPALRFIPLKQRRLWNAGKPIIQRQHSWIYRVWGLKLFAIIGQTEENLGYCRLERREDALIRCADG